MKLDIASVNDNKAWPLWSLSAATCFLLVLAFSGTSGSFFWDYHVYEKGLSCYTQGPNPYACASGDFPFVYPPIFLKVFSVIDFPTAFVFLVLASAAGIAYVSVSLRSSIPLHRLAPCLILGFLICGSGFASIQTGNISVFAHLLLVSLAWFLYTKRSIYSIALYAIAIVLFSAIKPYFLAYALLYLFLPRRCWLAFVAVLLSVAGIYTAQPALYPELWAGFQGAIYNQIIQHGDAGLTIFGVFSKFGMGKIGFVLHLLLMLAVVVISALLRYRNGQRSLQISSASELFYFLAILILLNPRLMSYDFSVFAVCLYLSMILSSRGDGWVGLFLKTFPFLTILPLCLEGLFDIRVHSLTYYFLATYVLLIAAVACRWPLRASWAKAPVTIAHGK